MDIRNCRRCGKMFSYNKVPICPECVKKDDEQFDIARTYIKDHPGCRMQDVSTEMGISLKLLTKWLKEKKIEFTDGIDALLSCEKCGAPIYSGRMCNACLGKLGAELLTESNKGKAPISPPVPKDNKSKGMHITQRNN